MAKERFIDIVEFPSGLRVLEDETNSPVGSARVAQNILISDRGGLSKRPGTAILGSLNSNNNGCKGFYIFKKPFTNVELPVKAYDDEYEFYHPSLLSWNRIESGFTVGSEWGFREHIRNVENEDYLYSGNRTEDYRRWPGSYTQLNGALVGGETAIVVDSTIKSGTFYSGTATGNSATTLTVSGQTWATDQWKNFYVLITGTSKLRKISANTADTLTFATLGAGPGNVAFTIVMAAFPDTGTLVVGGTEVAYTAIDKSTEFTVASAPVASDNASVTIKPTPYTGAPKGNRFEVNFDRILVGNVRSGVSRDSSGNTQGSQSTGSVYVSKLRNGTDFTFAATRVAGEGDIISFPEGNGDLQDIANLEDSFYVFFPNAITGVKYSQDSNDIAAKTPIKNGTGAVGRVIKGENDIYFVTPDNKLSSIGRQMNKDATPQVENMGLMIKRMTDDMDFTNHNGARFKQRIFHACKASTADTYNNRTIVFNEQTRSYEGVWTIPAYGFGIYNKKLHYADARTPNIYEMFIGTSDYDGTNRYAISSEWKSNWINLTPSRANQQSVSAIAVEGYLWGGTDITFQIFKDFSNTASLSFTFGADETSFMDADNLSAFLGSNPLGLSPLGSISGIQGDGSRHFSFIVYFPFIYANYYSIGLQESEINGKFDITRFGLNVNEDTSFNAAKIKTI